MGKVRILIPASWTAAGTNQAHKFLFLYNNPRFRAVIPVYKSLRMKQTFTQLQLVRLVYGETTPSEADMLLELALTVPELGESLADLQAGKQALDGFLPAPPAVAIDRILAHSLATHPAPAN
jgi:hypothetical protein